MSDDPKIENVKSLPIRSFGVGCFHFQLKDRLDNSDLRNRYTSLLKDLIANLPNVEQVDIKKFLVFSAAQELSELDDDQEIQSSHGVYPWPAAWEFSFQIRIPKNIQKELDSDERLESEKFLVRIQYPLGRMPGMPVALIEGIDCVLSRPSGAVVVIRKYFEKYAPKDKSVVFCCIGPSPFHANFYVFEKKSEHDPDVEVFEKRGYDKINWCVDVKNIDYEMERIFAHVSSELGIYYRVVQSSNRVRHNWLKIQKSINRLFKIARTENKLFSRRYGREAQKLLSDTTLDLADFKLEIDRFSRIQKDELADLQRIDGLDTFRGFTELELVRHNDYPLNDVSKILSLLERQSKSETSNYAVIIAALIGAASGFIGGIVGAALSIK